MSEKKKNMPPESMMDIPNSLMGPADFPVGGESLELFAERQKNVLWLTVREGRKLILKGLREELRTHPEEVARLHKEYSLGMRINHHGVAGVYGFETHPEAGPVIVMEYVDGVSLDIFLKKANTSEGKPLPVKQRLGIACQIADALQYIHSLGLSHRDIKPDNILISRSRNNAKIIDLGLGDSEDSVIYKNSLGTQQFGAPEQQVASASNSKADVYSFGKILEMLLPEKRYRSLCRECQQEDALRRPSMAEVATQLTHLSERKLNMKVAAVFVGLVVVGFSMGGFFLVINSDGKTTDNIKPSMAATNPVTSEEIATDSTATFVAKVDSEPIEEPQVAQPTKKSSENKIIEVFKKETSQTDTVTTKACEAIFEKYTTEVDKVIKSYGNLFDPASGFKPQIEERTNKTFAIAKRLEDELEQQGLSTLEISRLLTYYWELVQNSCNKIDRVYEVLDSLEKGKKENQ